MKQRRSEELSLRRIWRCKGDPAGRDVNWGGRCGLMYQDSGWCLVSEARRRRRPDRQPGKQAEDDGNGEHPTGSAGGRGGVVGRQSVCSWNLSYGD
jgi:hypothetical protein